MTHPSVLAAREVATRMKWMQRSEQGFLLATFSLPLIFLAASIGFLLFSWVLYIFAFSLLVLISGAVLNVYANVRVDRLDAVTTAKTKKWLQDILEEEKSEKLNKLIVST